MHRLADNVKTNLIEVEWEEVDCLFLLRIQKADRGFFYVVMWLQLS